MVISMIAASTAAKLLVVAKIAGAVGPVFIAAQRVADENERRKRRRVD